MSEHAEQSALIKWAGLAAGTMPELNLLYAIPNGGLRNKITAAKLKREGVKAGIPDLCLPVARREFHGLYIEMKHGIGRVSENQARWHANLIQQRYAVFVCYGWEAAKDVLTAYLTDGTIDGLLVVH